VDKPVGHLAGARRHRWVRRRDLFEPSAHHELAVVASVILPRLRGVQRVTRVARHLASSGSCRGTRRTATRPRARERPGAHAVRRRAGALPGTRSDPPSASERRRSDPARRSRTQPRWPRPTQPTAVIDLDAAWTSLPLACTSASGLRRAVGRLVRCVALGAYLRFAGADRLVWGHASTRSNGSSAAARDVGE
jgi:hypothetical protein